jgi:cytosolic phospholipase A2
MPRHYDRQLVISSDPQELKKTLTEYEYRSLPVVNIGTLSGNFFYLVYKDDQLAGYNLVNWKAIQPLITLLQRAEKVVQEVARALIADYPAVKQNPYKMKIATVIQPASQQMSMKILANNRTEKVNYREQVYLAKRKTYVAFHLQKLLKRNIDPEHLPKIALVTSGGGYRAMISTVGSLIAAQETGLLDVVTWLVSLSGSTWAVGGWVSRGIALQEFKKLLLTKMNKKIQSFTLHEAGLLINALMIKIAFGQKITIVDLYGGFLANRLLSDFGDARHRVYLSKQVEQIQEGNWVFPIYTAVRRGIGLLPTWYEFTPYEIGSAALDLYTPTWAYGRKFKEGQSVDFAPEQSLGYHFGTFGSAFAVTFERVYGELIEASSGVKKTILEFIFNKIIKQVTGEIRLAEIGKKRVRSSWAEVFNFTKGIQASPLKGQKFLKLVDAGIEFNLPYPPISGERSAGRKADIIIFLDYSGDIQSASELKKCEEYARVKGLKFPSINYKGITEKAISIFKNENNPTVPVVIYLPLVKDNKLWEQYRDKPTFKQFQEYLDTFDPVKCEEEEFCSTFNFQYKPWEAEQLSTQTEFNLKASIGKIVEAINWVVDRKTDS